MHNGENAFEVLLCLYKQCKQHTRYEDMRFLYINGFILESCHICMGSLIICLHRNVNNSKFIKKIRLAPPPPPPLNRLTRNTSFSFHHSATKVYQIIILPINHTTLEYSTSITYHFTPPMVQSQSGNDDILKPNFIEYPAIHTNYS